MKKYLFYFILTSFSLINNQINAKLKDKIKETYILVERKAPQNSYNTIKSSLMSLYDKEPKEAIIELPFGNVNQKFTIEKRDVDFLNSFTFSSNGAFTAGKMSTGVNYVVKNEYDEYCGQLTVYDDNFFCDVTHLNHTISITNNNKGKINFKYIEGNNEKQYKNVIDLVTNNKVFEKTHTTINIKNKLDSILETQNNDKPKPIKNELELDFVSDIDNDGVTPKDPPNTAMLVAERNFESGAAACVSIPLYVNISYEYYLKSQHPANVQTGMDSVAFKRVYQKVRYYLNRAIEIYQNQGIFLHIGFIHVQSRNDVNYLDKRVWESILGQITFEDRSGYKFTVPGFQQWYPPKLEFNLGQANIWDNGEWLKAKNYLAKRRGAKRSYTQGLHYDVERLWYAITVKYYYTPGIGQRDSAYFKIFDDGLDSYVYLRDTINDVDTTIRKKRTVIPRGLFLYIGEPKLLVDNDDPTNPQSTEPTQEEVTIRRYTSTNKNIMDLQRINFENVHGGYNSRNFLPMYSNMPNTLNELTELNDCGCHLKDIGYYRSGASTRYWSEWLWSWNLSSGTFSEGIITLLGDSSYHTYDPPPYTSIYPTPSASNTKWNLKDHVELYGEKQEFGNTDYPAFNIAKWNTWMIVHNIAGQLGARVFHNMMTKNDILSPVARNGNVNPWSYNYGYGSPRPHNNPPTVYQYQHQFDKFSEAFKNYASRFWIENTLTSLGARTGDIFGGGRPLGNTTPAWGKIFTRLNNQISLNTLFQILFAVPAGNPWNTALLQSKSYKWISQIGQLIRYGTTSNSGPTGTTNISIQPFGFTNPASGAQYGIFSTASWYNAYQGPTGLGQSGPDWIFGSAWKGMITSAIISPIVYNLIDFSFFYLQYKGDIDNYSDYYSAWNELYPEINDHRIFTDINSKQNANYGLLDLGVIPAFSPVDFVSFNKGIHKTTIQDLRLMLQSRLPGVSGTSSDLWSHSRINPYAQILNEGKTNYAFGGDTIRFRALDSALIRVFKSGTDANSVTRILNVPFNTLTQNEKKTEKEFAEYLAGYSNNYGMSNADFRRNFFLTGHTQAAMVKDSLLFRWAFPGATLVNVITDTVNPKIDTNTVNYRLPNVNALTILPVNLRTVGRQRFNYEVKKSSTWNTRMEFIKQNAGFLDTTSAKNLLENKGTWYFLTAGNLGCNSNLVRKYVRIYPRTFLPIEEKFNHWYQDNQSLLNWEFIGPWSSGDGPSEYKIWREGHYVKGTGPIRDRKLLAGTGWARATSEFKNNLAGTSSNWDGLVYIPRTETPPLTSKRLKYFDWNYDADSYFTNWNDVYSYGVPIGTQNYNFNNDSPLNLFKFRGQNGNIPPSPIKNWYSKFGFPMGQRIIEYSGNIYSTYGYIHTYNNSLDVLKDGLSLKYITGTWDNKYYPNHCAYNFWRRNTADTARSPMYLNNDTHNNMMVVSFDISSFVIPNKDMTTPYDKSWYFHTAQNFVGKNKINYWSNFKNLFYDNTNTPIYEIHNGMVKWKTEQVPNGNPNAYDCKLVRDGINYGDTSTLKRNTYIELMTDTLALYLYTNGDIKEPHLIWKKGGEELLLIKRNWNANNQCTSGCVGYLTGFDTWRPLIGGLYRTGLPYEYSINGDFRQLPQSEWCFPIGSQTGTIVTEVPNYSQDWLSPYMPHKIWHKPKAMYDSREWTRFSIDISRFDTARSVQFDFVYLNGDAYHGQTRYDGNIVSKEYEMEGYFIRDNMKRSDKQYTEFDLGSRHSPLFITNFKVYSTGQLPLANGVVVQDSVQGEVGCDKCVNISLKLDAGHNATSYQIFRVNNDNINSTLIASGNITNNYFANPNDTGYTPNSAGNFGSINVCNIRYGQTARFFAKIINSSGNTLEDTTITPIFTTTNTCIPCKVKAPLLVVDSSFNRDGRYSLKAYFSNQHNAKRITLSYFKNIDEGWTSVGNGYQNLADPNGNTFWFGNFGYTAGNNQPTFGVYTFPEITNQPNGVKNYRVVASSDICEPTTNNSNQVDVTVCLGCKVLRKPILNTDSNNTNNGNYNIRINLPRNHNAQRIQLFERTANTLPSNIFGNLIRTITLSSNEPFNYNETFTNKPNGDYVYRAVTINNTLPKPANQVSSDDFGIQVLNSPTDCTPINPYISNPYTTSEKIRLRFDINMNCNTGKNKVIMYRLGSNSNYSPSDPDLIDPILDLLPTGPPLIKFSTNRTGNITFTASELQSKSFNREITPPLTIFNCWYKIEMICESCAENNKKVFYRYIKRQTRQD